MACSNDCECKGGPTGVCSCGCGLGVVTTVRCERCGETFEPGWAKLPDDKPEVFCSNDCYEQYFQHALAEE